MATIDAAQHAAPVGQRRGDVVPEVAMGRAALLAAVPIALVLTVPAGLLRGSGGVLAVLVITVLWVGMFAVTGLVHGWAAPRGPVALQAVAMGGLFVRLLVYASTLLLLRPLEVIDPATLVVATPVVVFALLAYEVRFLTVRRETRFLEEPADRKDRP